MFKRFAIAAAVLLGVSGVSQAFQAAQPPVRRGAGRAGASMRRGRGNLGVITAISGTTYTIKALRGADVKATITADTPVVKPDRSVGAIADLKVGVFVAVQGQPGDDGVVKATQVMIQNPFVMGTIQAISAKRITVKSVDGKLSTFLIDAKTTVRKAGQAAKWSDYKVGDQVNVSYSGAAAVTIRQAQVGPAGRAFGGQRRAPRNGAAPTAPEAVAPPAEDAKPDNG